MSLKLSVVWNTCSLLVSRTNIILPSSQPPHSFDLCLFSTDGIPKLQVNIYDRMCACLRFVITVFTSTLNRCGMPEKKGWSDANALLFSCITGASQHPTFSDDSWSKFRFYFGNRIWRLLLDIIRIPMKCSQCIYADALFRNFVRLWRSQV